MDFLKYLFRNTAEYSDFNIFGLAHITILFIGILGIVFILKRMNVSRKFERILGIVLLAQQIILYTWYLRSGYKLLTEGLPLYHCRIAIIYFTNIYHISMFIFNHIIGSNYGYMRVSPIGIGNDLHPVVYGLIIIAIFNALIVFMNSLMNRQQKNNTNLMKLYA